MNENEKIEKVQYNLKQNSENLPLLLCDTTVQPIEKSIRYTGKRISVPSYQTKDISISGYHKLVTRFPHE